MYDRIVKRWKDANPLIAHSLGFHDYDGILPNLSQNAINSRVSELQEDLEYLNDMGKQNEKNNKFEYGLIKAALERELFELTVRKEFEENPIAFIGPLYLIQNSYTKRNFAPLDNRIASIIEIEKQIPSYYENAKKLLKESLPRAKIMMALQFFGGLVSYLRDDLIGFVTSTDNEQLIDEWSEANIVAVDTIDRFIEELKNYYMVKAHSNFAMGEEQFLTLLNRSEGVELTIDKLLEIGEADLEKNYQAMLKIAKDLNVDLDEFLDEIRTDYPDPENLITETEASLLRTKQFLIDRDIVTLPSDDICEVIYTPKYARSFAFAAMSTPGPFEPKEVSEAFYWVTPPDPTWSKERLKKFMQFFNRPFLEMITIHEAFPGHYLQLLYNRNAKSDIAKMFARSITMIEGWGHYCEQMIYDEGYEPFNKTRLHVGQLFGALIRNVRYISAIKMHCKGMSIEESKALFMEKGFMTEPTAEIESNRGTINPMYLNYTLGKLMILKLREDFKKEQGENYSLKDFHNKLLSFGSPPITVLRTMILDNPGSMADIL